MDDLSLEDLQAALVSVQEKKSTTRLSERNIIELVSKLQDLDLLDSGLLHSIQGKEYITPDQLCREVKAVLEAAEGRLAIADLPALLDVDLAHCERQADNVVRSSKGAVKIVQSELMTDLYFTGIAAEVGELLRESGMVAIGDMARRFKLSSELMQSSISSSLGKAIQGHLEAGVLYTSIYIARIKAQLRGALRGASRPVNLAALAKSLDLVAFSSSGKLVQSTVDELVHEGSVSGTAKAGTFVPSIFATAQLQAAQDFYTQNGFIEVEMLERLGVQDPAAYMASAYTDSLALEAVFMAPHFSEQITAAVEDAVLGGHWTDALGILPSAVGPKDAASLLHRACSNIPQGKILASTCVVSNKLLEELKERCGSLARETAEAVDRDRRASAKASTSQAQAQPASERKRQIQTTNSDDDDWDTDRGGSKKKKAGRRKPSAKQKSIPASGSQDLKSRQRVSESPGTVEMLSLESLTSRVEEWLPDAAGAGEDGTLLEALAVELRPTALAEFEKLQAAIFLAGAEARRQKRVAFGRAIEEANLRFQLYASGSEWFKDDETTHTTLQRHVLKTLGQRIFDLLLRIHEVEAASQEGDSASAADQSVANLEPVSQAERAQLLNQVPQDAASATLAANKALNNAEAMAGWSTLQDAANAAGLQLRKLDKKAEKSLLQEHKAVLTERLKAEDSPAEALSLAVPLLVAQVAGKGISVPGKALGGIISRLKESLPAEQVALLTEVHRLVVEQLRSQARTQDPRLTECLSGLKLIASASQEQASKPA